MADQVFAGIETGGTKILARLVSAQGQVLADGRWPTTTPDRALEDLTAFLEKASAPGRSLAGIGIAAFGPLVRDERSADYGLVLSTPKLRWSGSNLRAALAARFGVAVGIDTDVNAAARAEWQRGAGRGMHTLAYVTVGTGIGGGLVVDGRSRGRCTPRSVTSGSLAGRRIGHRARARSTRIASKASPRDPPLPADSSPAARSPAIRGCSGSWPAISASSPRR
jgi:ROK family